jgi:hypothetical protein
MYPCSMLTDDTNLRQTYHNLGSKKCSHKVSRNYLVVNKIMFSMYTASFQELLDVLNTQWYRVFRKWVKIHLLFAFVKLKASSQLSWNETSAWASCIQYTIPHVIPLQSILMLASCLRVLIRASFSLCRPAKQLYAFLTSSMNTAGSASPFLLDFNKLIMQTIFINWYEKRIVKLRQCTRGI